MVLDDAARCRAIVGRGSYRGSADLRCREPREPGSLYCLRHRARAFEGLPGAEQDTRPPKTDDEALGIRSARASGVVRAWSCGCAEVEDGRDTEGRVILREQPSLTCDKGAEHRARLVVGRAEQKGLPW